jgi:hypothetical protein
MGVAGVAAWSIDTGGGSSAPPDPDALFDTRTGLNITDSVGGLTLAIEKFPSAYFDRTIKGTNFSFKTNYLHNPTTDWAFLATVKAINNDTNSSFYIYGLNGSALNYIHVYVYTNQVRMLIYLNNVNKYVGLFNVLSDWYADYFLIGCSWEDSTQKLTPIFRGIQTVQNTGISDPQGSTPAYLSLTSNDKYYIKDLLFYNKKLSTPEISAAVSGTFPSDPVYFMDFGAGSRDNWFVSSRDLYDSVGGVKSVYYQLGFQNDSCYDIKNDNAIFSPFMLNMGYTQRDVHQIAYPPSGVKSIGDVAYDIECPPTNCIHNLAHSYINGNPTNHSMVWANDADKLYAVWDKSNRTIWKATIETVNSGVHYRQDNNGNYTLWCPLDELNEDFITSQAQSGHEHHIFCGLRTSGANITGLTKIAVFKVNIT